MRVKNIGVSKKEQIFNYLVHQEGYTSAEDLSSIFKISNRTLYYTFKSLNKDLLSKGLEPIQNVRNEGYYLKRSTKEKILETWEDIEESTPIKYSKEERCNIDILLSLINYKKVTLEWLSEIEDVSRNTVISDIDNCRRVLENSGLSLLNDPKNGYWLNGEEEDIRWWFHEFIGNYSKLYTEITESGFFRKLTNRETVKRINGVTSTWLEDVERLTGKHFSDDTINMLSIFIPFVIQRILKSKTITTIKEYELNVLRSYPEYDLVSQLLKFFEINLEVSENEIFYIETLLLSSQINFISAESKYAPQKFTGLDSIVEKVILRFQQISGVDFGNTHELKKNLYVHLLACYYRVRYGVKYQNRLLKQIKKNYGNVFSFTRFSIQPFEAFCKHSISEDEISLISIYFGAEIDKQKRNKISNTVQKVLIVCSSGIGTSVILKQRLQSIFPFVGFEGPITEREYLRQNEIHENLVVSTVKIPEKDKKVITVHSIPDNQDLKILTKNLIQFDIYRNELVSSILDVVSDYAKIYDFSGLTEGLIQLFNKPNFKSETGGVYQPMLSELLTKNTVRVEKNDGMNWKTAIQKSASPLLEGEEITQEYIDAMIDVVNQHGPFINIGREVALAHARPENGVKHLGMSLLKLDKPVDLVDKEHPVTLFITLAAVDNTAHLKALSQLATLLGKEDKLEQLLNANSEDEILSIIKEEENVQ